MRVLLRSTSSTRLIEDLPVERVIGDILDPASLDRALEGTEIVYHVAGLMESKRAEHFQLYNTQGTINLLQALERQKAAGKSSLERLVFVSSLAAGGPMPRYQLRCEEDRDEPISAYGRSKLDAEQALLQRKDSIPSVIVRPGLIYGPGDRQVLILGRMIQRGIVFNPRGSTRSGLKYFSFIHVDDVIEALVRSAFSENASKISSGEIFYLSADEIVSSQDFISAFSSALKRSPLKIPVSDLLFKTVGLFLPWVTSDKIKEISQDYWICSNIKARELLGFRPKWSLFQGVEDTVKWYRENQWLRA